MKSSRPIKGPKDKSSSKSHGILVLNICFPTFSYFPDNSMRVLLSHLKWVLFVPELMSRLSLNNFTFIFLSKKCNENPF